jgi:phosphonopyruvate decarboxylase
MIDPKLLFSALTSAGIDFYAGVPDSLLKDFCAYISDHTSKTFNVITANEGNAVALASGHYLGSSRPGLVYLQNSGLGNTINPLLSLNDKEVYGIPVLLMIGWRGEPATEDEPQHIKQGRITPALLNAMEIPWQFLDKDTSDITAVVQRAISQMRKANGPAALLVRAGTFQKYRQKDITSSNYLLSREEAIQRLVDTLDPQDRVVSTTGMCSRELNEYRLTRGDMPGLDFLTVGSMGHAASLALGLARSQTKRRVICLDGDGSILMHLGALAIIGQSGQENFIHVVLNNGAHDSVGGQQTCAFSIDIGGIARACGYRSVESADSRESVDAIFPELLKSKGPALLEIRIRKGSRKDLGRPQATPIENRDALMAGLGLLSI